MEPHARKYVLCVEDDADTSAMLSSLLGLINCEVETASTMGEGLNKIETGRFNLYLLDNWLPGGSGLELCRKIRESDSHTPILFYSAAGYEDERQAAMEAGAQVYLVKPSDINKLVETVRNLLHPTTD
jgi:DNA-binding response OmpR family regulator